jgi:hypothetical protein
MYSRSFAHVLRQGMQDNELLESGGVPEII